jgi:hypothetical protein
MFIRQITATLLYILVTASGPALAMGIGKQRRVASDPVHQKLSRQLDLIRLNGQFDLALNRINESGLSREEKHALYRELMQRAGDTIAQLGGR